MDGAPLLSALIFNVLALKICFICIILIDYDKNMILP